MQLRAAIFDLDGLLIDSEPIYRRAWQHALREFGFELSAEAHRSLTGRGREGALEAAVKLAKPMAVDKGKLNELLNLYELRFFAEGPLPIKPGAVELLEFLFQKRILRALATSTLREKAVARLKRTGLSQSFEVLVCGDEVAKGKPDPQIFLAAASRLRAAAAECIVFEDAPSGIEAARRAGMLACLVPDDYQPSAEILAHANYVFSSLSEALALFR